MSWVKIDDQFADHPKVMQVGPIAGWLFICGLCYCSRQLTDGKIPKSQVRKLADIDDAVAVTADLVECGMWIDRGDHYEIHDYLDYNPSRESVLAERERNRLKVSEWRARNPVSNQVTEPVRNQGCNPVSTIRPVPDPNPVPVLPESRIPGPDQTSKALRAPRAKNGASEPAPSSETWNAYSEAYEERYQAKPVRNAKVNSILAKFVERVPASEAPSIASWFVWHNGRWYVEKGHSVECLLKDAEALRTQWKTGKAVTSHKAREADRLQGTGDMWREIKDELRAEGKLT